VTEWRVKKATATEVRRSAKTTSLILRQLTVAGPQTPASIAAALGIPGERAKKAMQRMARTGELMRTHSGYAIASTLGTFQRITTSL
jgi:hypothetical protein